MFQRLIPLPKEPKESLFLWGPRQSGKSFWLRTLYPNAITIDLLKTDQYLRYLQKPSLLREEWLGGEYQNTDVVIIDEIQKVPMLLDEVHFLIENEQAVFILCGSSARKVRRGHANLLGGRALRFEMHGLVSSEMGSDFSFDRALNQGNLPRHYLSSYPRRMIESYVQDYLKEEIAVEGMVRNLPIFSDFLRVAAISDTEMINYSTIARDCGISSPTVKAYFEILTDTMIGSFLPSYVARPKRKVIQASKFFFSDIGIVNYLAQRGTLESGSDLYGKALENWIYHELRTYSEYAEKFFPLFYWRLTNGLEVDFLIPGANGIEIALEIKAKKSVKSHDFKGLYELKNEHPEVKRCMLICLEEKRRKTEQGIEIWPAQLFLQELWQGGII